MKMARIIENIAARVVIYAVKKSFKGGTIMQIFTRVDFVAQIHTLLIKAVEYWPPSAGQFSKCLFKQQGVMGRPRVEIRPGQRAGKGCMRA